MKAFKCDVTGELIEGEGKTEVKVECAKGLSFAVITYHKDGRNRVSGEVGDKGAAKIADAMQAVFGKPEAESEPAKK